MRSQWRAAELGVQREIRASIRLCLKHGMPGMRAISGKPIDIFQPSWRKLAGEGPGSPEPAPERQLHVNLVTDLRELPLAADC